MPTGVYLTVDSGWKTIRLAAVYRVIGSSGLASTLWLIGRHPLFSTRCGMEFTRFMEQRFNCIVSTGKQCKLLT